MHCPDNRTKEMPGFLSESSRLVLKKTEMAVLLPLVSFPRATSTCEVGNNEVFRNRDRIRHGFSKEEASEKDRQAQASETTEGAAPQEQVIVPRGQGRTFGMFSTLHFVAGILLVVGFLTWGVPRVGAAETAPDDIPADLKLSARDMRASEALSNFAWGLLLQYQGRRPFKDISPYYLRALARAPENRELFELLITPWLMHRDYDALIAGLGPIARANPDVIHLQLIYVEALKARGENADAAEHLQAVLTKTRWEEPKLLRELFICLWREKRYDEIKAVLQKARRQRALKKSFVVAHAEAMFYNALASTGEKRSRGEKNIAKLKKKALDAAGRALKLAERAERPEDILSLAQVFVANNDWKDVLALTNSVKAGSRDPKFLVLKIKALEELGRTDEAVKVIDGLRKNGVPHPLLLAEMARLYMKAGKSEQAIRYFEQALQKAPRSIPIRLQLAFLYLTLNQPRKGIASLVPLRTLPPRGYLLLAHLYRKAALNKKALEALQAAEKEAEKMGDNEFLNADFHMFFATICEDLNKTTEAINQAEKANRLEPENPMVANFLGYVLADHNQQLERAEKLVRQALKKDPENVAYLDSLAWACYRLRKFEDALVVINRILMKTGENNRDPVILEHAGDIYAANGLTILARNFWFEAIDRGALRPDTIRAKINAGKNIE
jgi:tetratricopeptide (TPR) repeat protein